MLMVGLYIPKAKWGSFSVTLPHITPEHQLGSNHKDQVTDVVISHVNQMQMIASIDLTGACTDSVPMPF